MKKLTPFVLLVACLALLASGCGSKKKAAGTTTAHRRRPPSASSFKVGLVTDLGGLNDRGFNHLAYVGLQKAATDFGVQTRVVQSASPADYVPNLSALARQGYDLVIGVGFTEIQAMETVAKQYPKTHFAIVDVANADEGQPEERRGSPLQGAGGRLPRRLRRRARREGARRHGRLDGRRRRSSRRSTATSRATRRARRRRSRACRR